MNRRGTRRFTCTIDGVIVEGRPEGEGRWVIDVRRQGRAGLRIGLLLGGNGRYVAERNSRGARACTPGRNRPAALKPLLAWAATLPGWAHI
jgi:hypothetical protein